MFSIVDNFRQIMRKRFDSAIYDRFLWSTLVFVSRLNTENGLYFECPFFHIIPTFHSVSLCLYKNFLAFFHGNEIVYFALYIPIPTYKINIQNFAIIYRYAYNKRQCIPFYEKSNTIEKNSKTNIFYIFKC